MTIELDQHSIIGTFTSTGVSDHFPPLPHIHNNPIISFRITGTTGVFTGTVSLQRAILPGSTAGSTWVIVTDADGNAETYTAKQDKNIEVGPHWVYRLSCSALSSGTIDYAITR